MFAEVLGLGAERWRPADQLGETFALALPDTGQLLRPTRALVRSADAPPIALSWDLPLGLPFDERETVTGAWDYPPGAKLDRLLRHTGVPIGLLCNGTQLRLMYAPHGASTGALTFRFADMVTAAGKPLLDAFIMLLHARQWFSVPPDKQLPRLLAASREAQGKVTKELADQILEALHILLAGFEAADGGAALNAAYRDPDRGGEHVYAGLLTFMLRLVFVLKADAVLEALAPFATTTPPRAEAGRYIIQPGAERRRSGSHYTPRTLTAPIVEKTLAPLLATLGDEPTSAQLLALKICDPAMGSGAFLVETVRQLGDHVVAAWRREGRAGGLFAAHGPANTAADAVPLARRLVAQRCVYGVDKNPHAVTLAKLSLWLITLARDKPFTFVDHALRHGDSLVGLDLDQLTAFHWEPGAQVDVVETELRQVLDEAVTARERIVALAVDDTPAAQREKERLLRDAGDAVGRLRLIGDLVLGAFFSSDKPKEREAERVRRRDLVAAWLASGRDTVPHELAELAAEFRAQIPAFHWMIELPEVFWARRKDPLNKDKLDGRAWIDAFLGNPPFLGQAVFQDRSATPIEIGCSSYTQDRTASQISWRTFSAAAGSCLGIMAQWGSLLPTRSRKGTPARAD